MKTQFKLAAAATLALAAGTAQAAVTVVNFDDLIGSDLVATGYGGINWASNWIYYDSDQDPYNATSLFQRIYTNYDLNPAGNTQPVPFYFPTATRFQGASFAGYSDPVHFDLYRLGVLVGTSGTLAPSATPTFLSAGYAGLVDEVRIFGTNGAYVVDNITYGAIPEPASWALMIAGFGMVGGALRRRAVVAA